MVGFGLDEENAATLPHGTGETTAWVTVSAMKRATQGFALVGNFSSLKYY